MLVVGYALVEDLPQEQPQGYALGVEGFATKEEGSRWTSCEPSQELQGKKKKDKTKLTENDSIENEEDRANEQELAGMNVTKNEALSYEKGEKEKQPTTYAPDR